MVGRPSKPVALVRGHRTKAEKELRAAEEARLITGYRMKEDKEVRDNPISHAEFHRMQKLFKSINKDDDLIANAINIHCKLTAECSEYEDLKVQLTNDLNKLETEHQDKKIDFTTYLDEADKLRNAIFTCDKKIMEKRKMILDIARENLMTQQSALRSIPKKPVVDPADESPMGKLLREHWSKSK